jgi:DNA-binding MarR family transcriptional regulator
MPRHQHVDEFAAPTPEDLDRLICAVRGVFRLGIDERLGVFGMSAVQCRALQIISDHPGLPQCQLARVMGQSAQAFGTLLARLLMGDYLVRHRHRGHATTHELTAYGRFMLRQAHEIAHEVRVLLFAPLTDEERRSLEALLRRVLDASWRLRFHPVPECP